MFIRKTEHDTSGTATATIFHTPAWNGDRFAGLAPEGVVVVGTTLEMNHVYSTYTSTDNMQNKLELE